MNEILIILVFLIIIYVIYTLGKQETFWGGYFPVPFAGQSLRHYGRSGVDAATDVAPRLFVDINACNINPYCSKCRGYRCCC